MLRLAIDTSKAWWSQSVTKKVMEGDINPSLLMSNIHEANKMKHSLLTSHVSSVLDNSAIFLLSKPWLVEISVKLLDDRILVLFQPCCMLLLQ